MSGKLSAGARVLVVGAGVFGLWQSLALSRAGFRVQLWDESAEPFAAAQSRYAGAMLSPYCEEEGSHALVRDLGVAAIKMWRETCSGVVASGTLVVAHARDVSELGRFARATTGYETVDGETITKLEPDLGGRFANGLFYSQEAHMVTPEALAHLLGLVREAGVEVLLGHQWDGSVPSDCDALIDCRGMGAQVAMTNLRGVRGERIVIRSDEVTLARPIRLLHPRHPLYVVPWGHGQFMVGATVIESEDESPVTVRSALELLGLAYALHPSFAEAEIVDMGAGLRPSFPDNLPRAIVEGGIIRVNGAYRHGFLLAPVLARDVQRYLSHGVSDGPLLSISFETV